MRFRAAAVPFLAGFCASAGAVTVVIPAGPQEISLRVGSAGATIDTVAFDVAGSNGDGTPITGTPSIFVEVTARRAGGPARTYSLTVDSSTAMTNGAETLPFTAISWTTSDGDIPAGTFAGTANQLLLQFDNNQAISNTHTFVYDNTRVLAPGTYTGQVTYTLAAP